jgi:hypothetical protein
MSVMRVSHHVGLCHAVVIVKDECCIKIAATGISRAFAPVLYARVLKDLSLVHTAG